MTIKQILMNRYNLTEEEVEDRIEKARQDFQIRMALKPKERSKLPEKYGLSPDFYEAIWSE